MSDERALIDRLASGDESVFDALARLYERALHSHAYRLLRNATHAEDAVQDAFLLAYRGRAGFRGGSFKAWVFRILTNRCLDLLREGQRRATVPLDPPVDTEDEAPTTETVARGPSVEEVVTGNVLLEEVERALAAVPVEQRLAVLLRDVHGFDYDEIARITNAEIGTVKSRIHRGRLAVRDHLVAKGWRSAGNPEAGAGVGR